jgi:hypothetical protein
MDRRAPLIGTDYWSSNPVQFFTRWLRMSVVLIVVFNTKGGVLKTPQSRIRGTRRLRPGE